MSELLVTSSSRQDAGSWNSRRAGMDGRKEGAFAAGGTSTATEKAVQLLEKLLLNGGTDVSRMGINDTIHMGMIPSIPQMYAWA